MGNLNELRVGAVIGADLTEHRVEANLIEATSIDSSVAELMNRGVDELLIELNSKVNFIEFGESSHTQRSRKK